MRTWVKAMTTNGQIFEGWKDEVDKQISSKGLSLSQYLVEEERDYVSVGDKILGFLGPLASKWAASQTPSVNISVPSVPSVAPPAPSTGKWANTAIIVGIGVVTILGIYMLTKKK